MVTRIIILFIAVLTLVSGIFLFYRLTKSLQMFYNAPQTPEKTSSPSAIPYLPDKPQTPPPSTTLFTPKPTTKSSTTINNRITPPIECYRYKITHLDGSTSNLCYVKNDYNELSRLGTELSSAKSFYEFHIRGADKYQELYNKDGSSLWLDAKKSQEQKAEEQKQKIDQINVQMYNMEKRGK